MIKNFRGFLFESESGGENYAFHFLESPELSNFLKKFNSQEKEEISELLDTLFDDFGIDFKIYTFLTINVNTKVGFGKKVILINFSKKWDDNLGILGPDRNQSGDSNLMPQLEILFPRYQEIGRDLNQIYLHISRIMEITDYKTEIPTKSRSNRLSNLTLDLRFELRSELIRIPEIDQIYRDYISKSEFDEDITKWFNESMEKLNKIFPPGSIPDTEILCQFVEEDGDSKGHWDIYVMFEEEYYSLSTYWLDDNTHSFHNREVERLKSDIKELRG